VVVFFFWFWGFGGGGGVGSSSATAGSGDLGGETRKGKASPGSKTPRSRDCS